MYGIFRGGVRLKTILNDVWEKIIYIYDMFISIEIVSNSAINLVIKIGALLIAFLIIKAILKRVFRSPDGASEQYVQPKHVQPEQYVQPEQSTKTFKTIDECISPEDLKFQMDQAEEEILNTIQKNRQEIKDTLKKANQTVDVSWIDSCNKILRVSNTLDNNLSYYKRKNLETSKFQYYANLHYRSMIAADISYAEYEKIDKSFREINQFIVRMKSRPEFRGSYKTQVYDQKDQIKLLRNFCLNRVHNMNHQTEELRDKIGSECGERGAEWWRKMTRHRN